MLNFSEAMRFLTRIDQDTVGILVGMASMRVRWENGDYSDILLNKAQIMDGIQTPTYRLIVRRIPEYADNLRNLLLLTIERSSALEGLNNKAKTVGLLLRSNDNEAGHIALLSVDGHPVTVKERSTSLSGSSTDERTLGMDESYKHTDTSSPFLQ